jgi:ketosteroid isomerase-like protein
MTTVHRLESDADELVDDFVERFQDFGANPTPDKYDLLFHTDGTLWDAGMDAPLPKSQLRAAADGFLRKIPDLHIAVRRYYARENCVYLLTDNVGTYNGIQVSYPAIDACRLRDGHIIEGRRYYDQARLLASTNSGIPVLPVYWPTWTPALVDTPAVGAGKDVDPASFVHRYDALWHAKPTDIPMGLAGCYNSDGMILNPGMIRPITKPEMPGYYETQLALAPDLNPELQGWAGDGHSLCVEWLYRASSLGDGHTPLALRVTDIFEFAGGGVQFGHAYFDSLTVVAAISPDLARQVSVAREKLFGWRSLSPLQHS